MANYHVGQTNLRIELETNVTLTGSTLIIKYRKPNKNTGQWSATINATDASKMYYDTTNITDLDQRGEWVFWAHVTFSDGTIGIGSAVEQIIKREGEI